MAAGSVAAPLIIPLQPRRTGNRISGSTPVSIRSDGALVLFTLDGSRPDAGGCRYTAPVLLPAGKVAVRAMAATRDGRRSAVVTKEFWVDPREDEAPGTGPGPGGPGPGPAGPAGPGPGGPGPAGPGPGPGPPGPAGPGPAEPPAGARFLSARFGSQTSLSGPAPSSSGPAPSGSGPAPSSSGPAPSGSRRQDGGRHGALPPPDPEGTRLQRDELLRCAGCPVAPSDPRARFCVQCGAEVQKLPPAGTGQQLWVCVCCGGVNPAAVSRCLTCESRPQPAAPGPAPPVRVAPPTADRSTQTNGPAAPQRPPLTAISPGRGYWRQQLDHVCAHLRSHAQNNAPFRALLGAPRLGRVVSALIQEDQQELSLTVSFRVAARRDQQGPGPGPGPVGPRGPGSGPRPVGPGPGPVGGPGTLSSVTERSADAQF
ncbi:double zinc ribbon and ankyrin repeat-containing protein 1 isoform 6-T6 [Menidia menidia]